MLFGNGSIFTQDFQQVFIRPDGSCKQQAENRNDTLKKILSKNHSQPFDKFSLANTCSQILIGIMYTVLKKKSRTDFLKCKSKKNAAEINGLRENSKCFFLIILLNSSHFLDRGLVHRAADPGPAGPEA